MLAQVGADPRQQLGEAKRLLSHNHWPGIETLDRVGFRIMSRQQDDRILKPFLAQLPDCLASVHIRQDRRPE